MAYLSPFSYILPCFPYQSLINYTECTQISLKLMYLSLQKASNGAISRPFYVPTLTVEDVFRNTMDKLFRRNTNNNGGGDKKKDCKGKSEANCVSCVVSSKRCCFYFRLPRL